MADEITVSSIASLTQAVIDNAILNIKTNGILANTVRKRQIPRGKKSVTFPVYGTVAMTALGEVEELTAPAGMVVTGTEVSPVRHGLLEIVGDMAEYAGPADFVETLGRKFGAAAIAIQNDDIWSLFAGFSQTAAGASTGSDLTEAIILSAYTMLQGQNAPGPYYLPVSPLMAPAFMKLYSANTNNVSNDIRNAVMVNGQLPAIFGIQPVLVTDITLGATTTTALYSADAIGMAVQYLLSIEVQRSAVRTADLIVPTSIYGVAEINDLFGVKIPVKNA